MKLRYALASAAAIAMSIPVLAHEGHGAAHGKGKINSVDVATHTINLSHEAISTLGWPAMKMDFAVANSVDLTKLNPGISVEFTLEKTKQGGYEISEIKPSPVR